MSRALVIKGANFETNRVAQVNFSGVPCTAVAFTSASYSPNSASVGTEMTITKTPADTTDVPVFSVSDSSVARVSGNMLYAVGFGTTTVTVTCGSAMATATVVVSTIEAGVEVATQKRVQATTSWTGTNPIQMSNNTSYDAVSDTEPDATKHNKIVGASGKSVIMIPIDTSSILINTGTYKNWEGYIRFTSTESPATEDNQYAGYVSYSQINDGNTGECTVSSIPSGADSFAFEIDHSDSEYSAIIVFQ